MPNGAFVYVTNLNDKTVSVISTATNGDRPLCRSEMVPLYRLRRQDTGTDRHGSPAPAFPDLVLPTNGLPF
jgi:hypothetical protein